MEVDKVLQLTSNVFVETQIRGCNHGFVTTSDGIVMIDSPQKPSDALKLKAEIAKHGEKMPHEVAHTIQISRRHQSLDMPFSDTDSNSLMDVIPDPESPEPDNNLIYDSLRKEISSALDTLKDRERDVIKMYFGIDQDYALTLNEIGEEFNLTRERVRQIKEKAIRRLQHKSRSTQLRPYL